MCKFAHLNNVPYFLYLFEHLKIGSTAENRCVTVSECDISTDMEIRGMELSSRGFNPVMFSLYYPHFRD